VGGELHSAPGSDDDGHPLMLSVRNGAKAVEFRKAAFGAPELFRLDDRDGAVVARFSVEGAEFRVADEFPQHLNFSPESLGGGTVRLVMIVNDPDAAFKRAVAAGAHRRSVRQQRLWLAPGTNCRSGRAWEIGSGRGRGLLRCNAKRVRIDLRPVQSHVDAGSPRPFCSPHPSTPVNSRRSQNATTRYPKLFFSAA